MKFTVNKHAAAQAAAVIATTGIIADADVAGIQRWIAVAITMLQGALAIAAHFRTPQGAKIDKSPEVVTESN